MRLDSGSKEPKEPKAKRARLTPNQARSLKEEGTAIALAVFAEVAAAKAGGMARGGAPGGTATPPVPSSANSVAAEPQVRALNRETEAKAEGRQKDRSGERRAALASSCRNININIQKK